MDDSYHVTDFEDILVKWLDLMREEENASARRSLKMSMNMMFGMSRTGFSSMSCPIRRRIVDEEFISTPVGQLAERLVVAGAIPWYTYHGSWSKDGTLAHLTKIAYDHMRSIPRCQFVTVICLETTYVIQDMLPAQRSDGIVCVTTIGHSLVPHDGPIPPGYLPSCDGIVPIVECRIGFQMGCVPVALRNIVMRQRRKLAYTCFGRTSYVWGD